MLKEDLTLLCGRDDFLLPGVGSVRYAIAWHGTTPGGNTGEAIYVINYNIHQEYPNRNPDGIINAENAQIVFP